jgi:hypothetical protein
LKLGACAPKFGHSKNASSRFAHEAAPALLNFANSSPMPFINGIKAARERIVEHSDEDRTGFLRRRGRPLTICDQEKCPSELYLVPVGGESLLVPSKARKKSLLCVFAPRRSSRRDLRESILPSAENRLQASLRTELPNHYPMLS